MKRPVPVVLTAILLGLLSAFQLLITVMMIIAGFVVLHKGLPGTPTPSPFPPSFMPAICFGTSLLTAVIAVWLFLTLIGLVRVRSWARYSVLVVAGCMAGFGALLTLTSFVMPFLMPAASPTTPSVDPNALRGIFFATGAVYALFTAIGVALLVYFNLAKTRTLFLLGTPAAVGPPNTINGRPRPTAVTVIGWLYMVSGLLCMVYVLLPFPAFLFGFVLYGLAAKLSYVVLGGLMFALGYGLYRLHNGARLAVFAMFLLCPIQMGVLMSAWGRNQFRAYMDTVSRFSGGLNSGTNPTQAIFASPGAIAFFVLLGMAGYGVILWLLHRHREAFAPSTAPPPLPPHPEVTAGLTS